MADQSILLVQSHGPVTVLQLNRPDVLNALNIPLMDLLIETMERLDTDPAVRCIVLTGNDRAFAAGADIKEMADASVVDMYERNNLARWERIKRIRKPIIGAVSGFCLGGGCELMMHCDIIFKHSIMDGYMFQCLGGAVPEKQKAIAALTERITRRLAPAAGT